MTTILKNWFLVANFDAFALPAQELAVLSE
jgi:hypothetical protein